MEVTKEIEGIVTRTFIIIYTDVDYYQVKKVTCTVGEIILDGCLKDFGIDPDEEYSLYTTTQYNHYETVIQLEIGEILEIDPGITLMRVA